MNQIDITDFHSHILFGMDDGAGSFSESLELIRADESQGVKRICLTPHFYIKNESVEHFLERRENAYESLLENYEGNMVFSQGAEVFYYRGISENERLLDLRIKGTKLLLLEMPFRTFTDFEIREIEEVCRISGIKLILAHFERYLDYNGFDTFMRLTESGAILQSNTSFFDGFLKKRKALKYLENGVLGILGSDAHSMSKRPPMFDKAVSSITKKFGEDFTKEFFDFGNKLYTDNLL